MEFIDKIYQVVIYLINTIKDFVGFFKNGMVEDEGPTLIDQTK